jgi:hypothetical protein
MGCLSVRNTRILSDEAVDSFYGTVYIDAIGHVDRFISWTVITNLDQSYTREQTQFDGTPC